MNRREMIRATAAALVAITVPATAAEPLPEWPKLWRKDATRSTRAHMRDLRKGDWFLIHYKTGEAFNNRAVSDPYFDAASGYWAIDVDEEHRVPEPV